MARAQLEMVDLLDWLPSPDPYDPHDPADPLADSEVDFDDELEQDQLPLDVVEAIEVGANLDDPELLAPT